MVKRLSIIGRDKLITHILGPVQQFIKTVSAHSCILLITLSDVLEQKILTSGLYVLLIDLKIVLLCNEFKSSTILDKTVRFREASLQCSPSATIEGCLIVNYNTFNTDFFAISIGLITEIENSTSNICSYLGHF